MAGYGWNISGISIITRIPSTKFHDGVIDGVDFDGLDRFALDGQRLIVKNGTTGIYGANGTVYETENFSNTKITSIGVHPDGANYGPDYFKVEYPDGSLAIYGNSLDSRTKIQYGITYWQNPQGVRINYLYNTISNDMNITEISYGSRYEEVSINKINFIYQTRQRPEQGYIGGLNIINTTIFTAIRKFYRKSKFTLLGVIFIGYYLIY